MGGLVMYVRPCGLQRGWLEWLLWWFPSTCLLDAVGDQGEEEEEEEAAGEGLTPDERRLLW